MSRSRSRADHNRLPLDGVNHAIATVRGRGLDHQRIRHVGAFESLARDGLMDRRPPGGTAADFKALRIDPAATRIEFGVEDVQVDARGALEVTTCCPTVALRVAESFPGGPACLSYDRRLGRSGFRVASS